MAKLNHVESAERLLGESVDLMRHANKHCSEFATALMELGEVALMRGEVASTASLYEESAAIVRGLPHSGLVVCPLGHLAGLAVDQQHYERAEACWTEVLLEI